MNNLNIQTEIRQADGSSNTTVSRRFFHELSIEEKQKLANEGKTWQDVMDDYNQPDWCTYPEALRGEMGCWSLIMIDAKLVCEDYCKTCECYAVANGG